ncbi:MAG: ATP-binding protein [Nitrospira sp.]|nr:ATP-binding protein [Nitrospira sp.]MDE0404344.1 ATP-binding protein [Nitrospira sp.]MDE0486000.1 ATP-binding protein [Nitrospira sp.]
MKRISLTPDLSSITELEQSLEEFASAHELNLGLQNHLNLMLEELITNSVNYSLPSVSGPELELRLSLEDAFVVAQVEDNGPAFDPFTEAPEADTTSALADRPVGGLGIFLTKKYSDEYTYERIGERNRVTLRCRSGKGP